jgi:hypothetical protein
MTSVSWIFGFAVAALALSPEVVKIVKESITLKKILICAFP